LNAHRLGILGSSLPFGRLGRVVTGTESQVGYR
jgi:hypothetical protein